MHKSTLDALDAPGRLRCACPCASSSGVSRRTHAHRTWKGQPRTTALQAVSTISSSPASKQQKHTSGHVPSVRRSLLGRAPVPAAWEPGRRLPVSRQGLWSVDAVFEKMRKKKFEEKTVERVYEADVYPAVFDFEAWHNHRSRKRYLEHCITLFRSYFFRDLLGPLTVLVGTAVAVGCYEQALQDHLLPGELPSFSGVSDTPFQLTSFALSLMLVFRTNSSYARWLDARQQWGLIVNTSRTFIRQVMTTLPESSCSELREAIARWTIAFVRLSKLHLREHGDVRAEMSGLLRGEELPLVAAAAHRPLAAAHVLSELLRTAEAAGRLSDQSRARLEADVNMLSQALGACEKILRNPIPLSYTRHTSRFLVLWLLWLPIALWGKVSWGVVPVEAILCYLLLGIDEIAIQMEEPFGILPLENFCDAVQQSVEQVATMDHGVQDVVASYVCHIVNSDSSNGFGAAAASQPPAVAAAAPPAVEEERGSGFANIFFKMPADRC